MKTNASKETVIKAVETVSKKKYGGNVILRRPPEDLTKNTIRFTLKTKDKNKAGSMVSKNGLKQPKADQQVYMDVLEEVFRIENKSHLYGDHAILGRINNENPDAINESDTVIIQDNVQVIAEPEETPEAVKNLSDEIQPKKKRGRKPGSKNRKPIKLETLQAQAATKEPKERTLSIGNPQLTKGFKKRILKAIEFVLSADEKKLERIEKMASR